MQRITGITLGLDEDEGLLKQKAATAAHVSPNKIKYLKIVKKAIDARRAAVKFVYTVDVSETPFAESRVETEEIKSDARIVVVGAGPCGLFAALNLARRGLKPLIIERGDAVEKRSRKVSAFFSGASLDTESNVQFGEGGAGTFSDGKLNTQVNNRLIGEVLEDFVRFGAPDEISYINKPHVGSDKLSAVVKNIREEIIRLGGEVRFNTRLENLIVKGGRLTAIKTNAGELRADVLVLALGHSARDTFEALFECGIEMTQKPFAAGLRVEQLQELINERQYGKFSGHKRLPPADYKLVSHKTERGVFSFCMCPGGVVVPAASENGGLVVNGMSNYLRDGVNANSAIVAQVGVSDFPSSHPLAGVELQRSMERAAFKLGGGDFVAPVQLAEDFVSDRETKRLKGVLPSYSRGFEFAKLDDIFPDAVSAALKASLVDLDGKLKGIASMGAVLTGVESRTSSPIRISRGENFESPSVRGLYPAGEGSGYAGGIMSAAADGIRVAEAIAERLKENGKL